MPGTAELQEQQRLSPRRHRVSHRQHLPPLELFPLVTRLSFNYHLQDSVI